MKYSELINGKHKNIIIAILMIISFFILLPNFIKVISWQMAPYTDDEVIITTVSYESEIDGEKNIIVGNLFQPAPKFGNREYPGIIACH
ncbi:MAG: hypothetical protein ACFFAO_19040, partial [Candidatus Hermodarchaeota archaeon]